MTRYGFISVTRARKGKGEHWQPVDSERLMVRHGLGAPRLTPGAFSGPPGPRSVRVPSADYRYRLFVSKAVWAAVVAELELDADYDNFKNEVAQSMPQGDEYLSALHRA